MRGKKGIYDATMLVRSSPFAEWVVVYYDPSQTNEKTILATIQNGGCRNSRVIRVAGDSTVMNPYITGGDTLQLRVDLDKAQTLAIPSLPTGWVLTTSLEKPLAAGVHYINVKTPSKGAQKRYSLNVVSDEKVEIRFVAEIVRWVR